MNRRLPVVRQVTETECGLACVAMLATYFGCQIDLATLRRRFTVSQRGVTLTDIVRQLRELKLSSRAIRCSRAELAELRLPCVLHWQFSHFVVLDRVERGGVTIHDPSRGRRFIANTELSEAFTGIALEVTPADGFTRTPPPPQLKLLQLLTRDALPMSTFAATIVLALIAEVLMLSSPYLLQLIIDEVIVKQDSDLLQVVALSFSLLLLLQISTTALRKLTVQFLSHASAHDLATRVMAKLFRLPVRYFMERQLGDVQHRLQAVARLQNFIVQSLPALLLDVLFVCIIAMLMLLYEPLVTLLVIGVIMLWCGWRRLIRTASGRHAENIASTEACVQTHLLESLRCIHTIKSAAGEASRQSEWQARLVDSIGARMRAGNLQIVDAAVQQTLFQGVRIAAVVLLAHRALQGSLSVGMISAYVAYLGMLLARSGSAIDRLFEYRLLDVPLARLADIVFATDEPDVAFRTARPVEEVLVEGASFAYTATEADVLRDCSLQVRAGTFVVIAGASGCGKSTLLELLAGNETLLRGRISFSGLAISQWSLESLRAQLALVSQHDALLQGSLMANIALFAAEPDTAAVRRAARQACIADDIERLPMGYHTRAGDLGVALSQGQIQRLLLARAFYRRPRLLLLDEVTNGLHRDLEAKVIASIAGFPATRIVVTHSQALIRAAEQVWWMRDGRLVSSRANFSKELDSGD